MNNILDSRRLTNARGQQPPSSQTIKVKGDIEKSGALLDAGEKIGEYGLELRPLRAVTPIDAEHADAAMVKFCATYDQFVHSPANFDKISNFLWTRGALCNMKNLTIAFQQLFGQFELRNIVKVDDSDKPAAASSDLKSPTFTPFLFEVADRRAAEKEAKRPHSIFPTPTRMELVETVLSPADVRVFSADDVTKFSNPMSFPQVTDSANDFLQSDEFKADSPVPAQKHGSQSEAQVAYEISAFMIGHPEYAKYLATVGGQWAQLRGLVPKKIEGWNLPITDTSLFDGFRCAESEGFLGNISDAAKGIQRAQVATFKITPDSRPHWTRDSAKRAADRMSSEEYQHALNSDDDFRKLMGG